jgi:hypothetical protein
MGEELHEILKNSSNEEYTENKHREEANAEINMEVDETEESAIQGEDDGGKSRNLLLFHVQSITLFYINVE